MLTEMNKRKKGLIIGISMAVIAGGVFISTVSADKLHEMVTVEAGIETLEASQFIINKKKQGTFSTDLSTIDMGVPGEYEIGIQIGRKVYPSKLKVEDTIAPRAETVDHEIWANEVKTAKDFVKNIVDATEVKISFVEQPNFSKGGSQEVLILLEDLGGNKTELKAVLNIKEDKDPPQIEGVQDQAIYVGGKISYKKDVTVTDNRDENVELVIDSSAVNPKEPGTYEVIYSATDVAGNVATEKTTVIVREKKKEVIDQNTLDRLADDILSSIIKDGMTDREKAHAIYRWIQKRIRYVNQSDKTSWINAAHEGIKTGLGDCFVYYATARELLTRAGFENQTVTRLGGGHYWNLVYCEDGWYHFDSSPRTRGHTFDCFLKTDAEVEEYSKGYRNYYTFDKTLHPATPIKENTNP